MIDTLSSYTVCDSDLATVAKYIATIRYNAANKVGPGCRKLMRTKTIEFYAKSESEAVEYALSRKDFPEAALVAFAAERG
jgi:hypothetical protein